MRIPVHTFMLLMMGKNWNATDPMLVVVLWVQNGLENRGVDRWRRSQQTWIDGRSFSTLWMVVQVGKSYCRRNYPVGIGLRER